ncbi:hypothetical protein [Amycolatopsis sulphurea]|uniref:hypothetical protein n=1 Tax=Amycolatopsis sulphurea TaxID=76022 RepID=UPI001145EA9F|nr:hypothetical protein [Amycolatopsis sulphurea]
MNAARRDGQSGVPVAFPAQEASPVGVSSGEVGPAGPVLDGELLTDEQYRRARRLADLARSRLPARWQDRNHFERVRADLVRHLVRAPFRYPAAVARGVPIAVRVWWSWMSVKDFYDAAKQTQQLANRYEEIHRFRVRRRWWTLATTATSGGGLTVASLVEGPVVWWIAGGAVSAGLAVAGRRKDGSGRSAVIRPRSIAWAMDGNNLVTAFRDARLIGKDDGLAFVQLPKRDGTGWAVEVDLPASRKASTAIAKREDLASALAVDEVQLIAERVRGKSGHAGRLSLWIADDDPYAAKPLDSPLGEVESWDFWQPTPFDTTARGQLVHLSLVWTSLLVGAIPRMARPTRPDPGHLRRPRPTRPAHRGRRQGRQGLEAVRAGDSPVHPQRPRRGDHPAGRRARRDGGRRRDPLRTTRRDGRRTVPRVEGHPGADPQPGSRHAADRDRDRDR